MTINYVYDDANRLTSVNGVPYSWDNNGNLLSDGVNTYAYDSAREAPPERGVGGNRLTSVNGVPYSWDNNGNLLSDGVNDYEYDAANRLKSVTTPLSLVQIAYNGLGDRLQETVDGQTTTFTMDFAAGLTQVLSDGTYDDLYGVGHIV